MNGRRFTTAVTKDKIPASPGRGITVGNLIGIMFGDTHDEEYTVSIRGMFGEAGLRRMNAKDNERADNEPFGDWEAVIGNAEFTIVLHDEDEARPEEGQKAVRELTSAMAACGRHVVRQSRRGSRQTVTYSAGSLSDAGELSRFRSWKRRKRDSLPK